jgi:hypothetical protein
MAFRGGIEVFRLSRAMPPRPSYGRIHRDGVGNMPYAAAISNGDPQGQITLTVCTFAALWLKTVLRNSRVRKAARRLPMPLRRLVLIARPWLAAPETVLLFAFPELKLGSDLRTRYDRSAREGMPPHVTLIYPFLPLHEIDGRRLRELTNFFAATTQFKVRLDGIAGFPGVVYLVPQPTERFVELVNGLVRLYPQVPPYGGIFQSVIPHMTLAESADPEVQDGLMSEVAPLLPIETKATEVWLMVRRGGRWKTKASFALTASRDVLVNEPRLLAAGLS